MQAVIQPSGVHAAGRAPIISILAGSRASSMLAARMPSCIASTFSALMRFASDWCQGENMVAGLENASMREVITLADALPVAVSNAAAVRAWSRGRMGWLRNG